jgi:serine/threonine protein phosphatase PrpC
MRFVIYQESRSGKRKYNQDRIANCYTRDALLMVVADGMGGHLRGEAAAQIAVQYLAESFQKHAHPKLPDPTLFLLECFEKAHAAILDYASREEMLESPRTTCVACVIQDGVAHWAHTGDSRLYHLRAGRILVQTKDHSHVQKLVNQGRIREEAVASHPERNTIYSCLGGTKTPQITLSPKATLIPGDIMMLCTDGVWGPLSGTLIASTLLGGNVIEAIPTLLDLAEKRGGEHQDNLSAVAVTWREPRKEKSPGQKPEEPKAGEQLVVTETMPLNSFTSQLRDFGAAEKESNKDVYLSDAEIEKAIGEIRDAIRKVSKP